MRTAKGLAAALLLAGIAGSAQADIHSRTIGKRGDPSTYMRVYRYDAGPGLKVDVIGPPAGQSHVRLADVANADRPLVIAGDYGTATTAGRGLFFRDGRAIAPFNPAFDTVICISNRKISMSRTSDYAANPVQVTRDCDTAFQTFPWMVRDGRNLISPAAQNEPAQKRIILAMKGRQTSVVIFPRPVSLYVAARVLSLPEPDGYGFEDAVSLSLNPDPTAYDYERLLVGNPARRAASAVIFDD